MLSQNKSICLAIFLWMVSSQNVSAAASEQFTTTEPENGKFVVEYEYNYVKKDYKPIVIFESVDKSNLSRNTPEESFIAHFSAMDKKDFKWWLSGWDVESQTKITARNKEKNRTEQSWTEIWEKAMKDQVIKMTQRVETGIYVFIVYEMSDKNGKKTFNSIYVCKKVGNEWLATEELAEDLMFQHYLEGGSKVTLNIR